MPRGQNLFPGNRRAVPKQKGIWILSCMLGEVCVTNRGRFRKPHVQTDARMLLTSVGSDSGAFVPRIRRNRKGSGCSTDPKSTCLACWGLSRGTVLALKSVQSLSSAVTSQRCQSRRRGKAYELQGEEEMASPSSPWCLNVKAKTWMEPAEDFHGSVVSLRACPVTPLLGFQVTALEIPCLGATWAKGHLQCWSCSCPCCWLSLYEDDAVLHSWICVSLQDARVQLQAGVLPSSRLDGFLQPHLIV